jgi:YVTN family beta-propeller protein
MSPAYSIKVTAVSLFTAFATASIAHAAPVDRVYIPTGDSAEVLIIDSNTHESVGRIPGLPAAHGLAVTPDGGRLIVGSFEERAPGEAMPDKPAGVSATDHAAHHAPRPSPESRAAVSTLSFIDTAAQSVVRRIDVPGAVHHVAVSPDGQLAAVTHPNSDAVTAIDLDRLVVIKTVKSGAFPNYAVFSADSAKLYVSNAADNAVAVLDTGKWAVTRRIAVGEGPEHLALSPDGRTLFVNNVDNGTVSVIDLSAEQAVDTLAFGATLHGVDVSDDGATLFVAVRGNDELAALDLHDKSRRSVSLSPAPYHLGVIRGKGVLYVSSAETSQIWVIDATTLETRDRIAVPGIGHQFGQVPGS